LRLIRLLRLVWLLLIRLHWHMLVDGVLVDHRLHFDLLLSDWSNAKLGVAGITTVAVEVDS
jgi:hypothetical protein